MRRKCLSYIATVLVMCLLTACVNNAQSFESGTIETESYGTEDGSEKSTGDSIVDTESQMIDANDSEMENQGNNSSNSEPTEDNPVDSEPTEEPADTEIKDTTSEDKPTENTSEKDSSSEDNSKDEPVDTEVKDEPTEEPADTEKDSEKEPEPEKPEYTFTKFDSAKTMYASSKVNVRNLPSSNGKKVGELIQRQPVEVTGKCNETGWYEVVYEGKVGYVSNNYLSENRVSIGDATDEEVWWEEEEAYKQPEPVYGVYTMVDNGDSWNPSEDSGWHYERGTKSYVWVVDNAETSEGHWEAKYEGHKDNRCSLDVLIPWLDKGFRWDFKEPTRDGAYEGEEIVPDFTVWVYLGGGEVEK